LASSLVALFQQSLDQAPKSSMGLTAQEEQILQRAIAAGSISAADYEAAHATFEACMTQHGVDDPWKKGVDGVYYPQGIDSTKVSFTSAQLSAARDVCEPEDYWVQSLYTVQQSNPDLYSDQREAAVVCLRRGGLVDASYTVDQFAADQAALTFPFDVYDPVANACLAGAGYLYVRLGD